MLDLVHSTYPPFGSAYLSKAYWDRAVQNPLRIKLAMESEWGHELKGDLSLARILEDAAKVAAVRADAKVIVFASHSKRSSRERVIDMLTSLRRQADPSERRRAREPAVTPWLWVDVPWDSQVEGTDCGL